MVFKDRPTQEEKPMKKKITRIAAIIAACVLAAASLAACGSSGSESAAPAADTPAGSSAEAAPAGSSAAPAPAAEGKTYNVGICQLVQHVALDSATQGFKDALVEALGEDAVVFDEQNASGDSATCSTICNGFVSDGVDLILANATPALQAAASATNSIPILGTSVTTYDAALNLTDYDGTVGGNISGTSDLAPLDQQAAMVKEIFPDAKTVGILYCSSEANSVYQADVMEKELTALGYTVNRYTFADSNDVSMVAQEACDGNDVLYIPTDNTAASNAPLIDTVAKETKTPIVAGEEGILAACGIVTLTIDYYGLGQITGQMAAEILTGESDISTMPIEYYPDVTKEYNAENAEFYGITIPSDYVKYEG